MYDNYCKLRDARGLKDADIAKITGITKSTFSDWKNGRSIPKNNKLQKVADYFGVSLDYLINGEDVTKSNLFSEYLSITQEAQDNNINPRQLRCALELLIKLKEID